MNKEKYLVKQRRPEIDYYRNRKVVITGEMDFLSLNLSAPADAESLASAMESVHSRPDAARAMGRQAREYVHHVFGAEAHYEATRRIYAWCLNRSGLMGFPVEKAT